MNKPKNCILVIFGASGDLTKRKLIPAVFNLYRQDLLPEEFAVLGVSRTNYNDESFRKKMLEDVDRFCKKTPIDPDVLGEFIKRIYYQCLDTKDVDDYVMLKEKLEKIDDQHHTEGNYIYYLATPPSLYQIIAQNLGSQQLHRQGDRSSWKRLIVEKPFGYDLDSAIQLNRDLQQIFLEDQIYRIDHYLGKETVQNTLAFRFANGIFEPLWNRNYVHHAEVTAAEHIGVENRGGYYDHSGALRDMIQNHLLQVVGLIAMESPPVYSADAVRNETVKVFQSLCPIKIQDVSKQVIRGQYVSSTIKGEKVPGYREENNVNPESRTETFVAMKFFIDNWRWGGVPFYIRTGKRLPTRVTEIAIHFKKTPHRLFTGNYTSYDEDNKLIIRIQPDEGILLKFGMKLPGAGFQIKEVGMDFHYSDLADVYLPDAYERLLLDCMLGDATLYARADAVETCWKFVNPVLQAWQDDPNIKIFGYPAGTWGPKESSELFENRKEDWRYPCKNLANDGIYCEL
jgi:glucose-6-phosphate 1-dehydrogenase